MTARDRGRTGTASRRQHHRACRHEWRLVSDDVDEFGRVRMLECDRCGSVHFS